MDIYQVNGFLPISFYKNADIGTRNPLPKNAILYFDPVEAQYISIAISGFIHFFKVEIISKWDSIFINCGSDPL